MLLGQNVPFEPPDRLDETWCSIGHLPPSQPRVTSDINIIDFSRRAFGGSACFFA
jgi:hypothetical protein